MSKVKKSPSATVSGTKEWSVASVNFNLGCEHCCRYCYARNTAVMRRKFCTIEEWGKEYNRLKQHPFSGFGKKYDGPVMFPTTHDLTPALLEPTLTGLKMLLEAGNDVLVVSKPHMSVIQALCKEFAGFKGHILFRFTIGALDHNILAYWEPSAPDFAERFACLRHAHKEGFKTSISCEPCLDSPNVVKLFYKLEPFITDSFWIGKMNRIRHADGTLYRVSPDTNSVEVDRIEAGQTDERVHAIYAALKDEPKIRWKESFKEVLGLETATEAGLDV